MKKKKGVTIMELTIVIAVVAILASAFSTVMIPMMNFFFYYPETSRVNDAAADVLQIIAEGDEKAKGLRFTGPPCGIPTGGSDTITTATASTLTYNYAQSDSCGGGGTASNSVALAYDSVNQIVTRSINGGTAVAIPYYATASSGIKINPPASTNFFRYYDAAGTELGAGLTAAARVDISVSATSGNGAVKSGSGQIQMKTGVDIKRFTT